MNMRAEMAVTSVEVFTDGEGKTTGEKVSYSCVAKSTSYGDDGLDEDNSFAKFSPFGVCTIQIANPALFGKYTVGMRFYVDFSPAE